MTTPQPLVSVTIASYNHERYVEETLRSVMAQSYPNLELILVDDGSPDRSGAICDGYAHVTLASE